MSFTARRRLPSVGNEYIPAVAKALTKPETVGAGLAAIGAFYLLDRAKKYSQGKAAELYDKTFNK